MIQRIQSFYLFVVIVLFSSMFMSPIADFVKNGVEYELTASGITAVKGGDIIASTLLLSIMEGIIVFVSLLELFMFKKRMIQIRLVIFDIVLMIGYYVLLGVYLYLAKKAGLYITLHISVLFPLIGAILSYLAVRAIGRDEALVRSMDHLR